MDKFPCGSSLKNLTHTIAFLYLYSFLQVALEYNASTAITCWARDLQSALLQHKNFL